MKLSLLHGLSVNSNLVQCCSALYIAHICGAPRLSLRYPNETTGASVQARVEFKLGFASLKASPREGLPHWRLVLTEWMLHGWSLNGMHVM